ncbi:diguanylate cyclase [Salinispirillum sp. LH 10-3-1]|uniref:Diguanylate cyclase n=1 Tax=Salinispirillum sp. LH 10-3-1 TaxID=2952525 RepID=A0AB38YEN2_9GAMM
MRAFARGFTLLLLSLAITAHAQEPLRIVQDHAWPPFSYLNQNNEPEGLLIDLWRDVAEALNRDVEFTLVDWGDTLSLVRDSEHLVHGGLLHSPQRAQYLDFSSTLLPLRATLFVANSAQNLNTLSMPDLTGRTVGVTRGGFEEEFMRDNHPNITLSLYDNNDLLVTAAVRGEIQAFVADYPVGMYFLDQKASPERFRVLTVLYELPLHAAVAANNQALLQEVEAGLALLGPEQIARITQKWMRTEQVAVLPRHLLPMLLVLIAAVIVPTLWFYNRQLQVKVARQTAELREREKRLSLLNENMADVIWTADADSCLSYLSPSIEKLLGYTPTELIGKPMIVTLTEESVHDALKLLGEAITAAREQAGTRYIDRMSELAQVRKDRSVVWTEVAVRAFFDINGNLEGAQGVSRDITERKLAQDAIRELAYYDPLTQLPNRRLLSDRLEQAVVSAVRRREHGAVLFLDLDNFKEINDAHGHEIGDQLLQQVARLISAQLRESDTVARLGGDEFIILLNHLPKDLTEATAEAQRLAHKVLDALHEKLVLEGKDCAVKASIGLTLFGQESDQAKELLREADNAMYQAKKAGRHCVVAYDQAVNTGSDHLG